MTDSSLHYTGLTCDAVPRQSTGQEVLHRQRPIVGRNTVPTVRQFIDEDQLYCRGRRLCFRACLSSHFDACSSLLPA